MCRCPFDGLLVIVSTDSRNKKFVSNQADALDIEAFKEVKDLHLIFRDKRSDLSADHQVLREVVLWRNQSDCLLLPCNLMNVVVAKELDFYRLKLRFVIRAVATPCIDLLIYSYNESEVVT